MITDPVNNAIYLSSAGLNVPDIIRCDPGSGQKTGSLVLDAGLPAIQTGALSFEGDTVWYGAGTTLIAMDTQSFSITRIIDTGNSTIQCILPAGESGRILALARGETDHILDIETETGNFVTYPLAGFSCQVRTAALSPSEAVLYVLVDTFPSQILAVDLSDFTIIDTATVPGAYQANMIAVNPAQDELYVSMPGTPAYIHRLLLPDLQEDGSVTLMDGERPSGFMVCDPAGQFLYVCDGDSSGGVIRVNLVLFQHQGRLDFGLSGRYPRCGSLNDTSLWAATDNRPGALLSIDLTSFQPGYTQVFDETAGSAGCILTAPESECVYFSVMNQGNPRIIGLDSELLTRETLIDISDAVGALVLNCGPRADSVSWWVETGEPSALISVNLDQGGVLQRSLLPEGGEWVGAVYSAAVNRVFLLAENCIHALDPDTLRTGYGGASAGDGSCDGNDPG